MSIDMKQSKRESQLGKEVQSWANQIGVPEATFKLIQMGIPASTVSKLLTGEYKPKQALLIRAIKQAMGLAA